MVTDRQLTIYAMTLLTGVAAGFLYLLFQGGKSLPITTRVTDIPAEIAAGTYKPVGGVAAAPKAEVVVDLEGEFEKLEGEIGTSAGTWKGFRGADADNIAKFSVVLWLHNLFWAYVAHCKRQGVQCTEKH